jgi:Spy/CpxP family protein refolding chaperone
MSRLARGYLRWLLGALVLALLTGSSTAALAQDKGKGGDDKHQKVGERLQQVRTRVLQKQVGLDAKTAEQVVKILTKYQPERKKLQSELRASRRAVRELLSQDSSDEAAYKKGIQGFRSAEKKLFDLKNKEIDEVSKLLTPKQQAKLVAVLLKLKRRLDRERGEGGE